MKITALSLLFCSFIGCAMADTVKISNGKADQLLASLMLIDSGLTAKSTTILADNINVLKPRVEAYGKGNQSALLKFKIVSGMKNDDPAVLAYTNEIQANFDTEITVELTPLSLTDDEIVAAKIKPATLAFIRQYLLPSPPKK